MFESIKSALTKETASTSNKQKDFLRTEVGNTYTVRLLPNIKDPTKLFFIITLMAGTVFQQVN